jgi:hypothetical protein
MTTRKYQRESAAKILDEVQLVSRGTDDMT